LGKYRIKPVMFMWWDAREVLGFFCCGSADSNLTVWFRHLHLITRALSGKKRKTLQYRENPIRGTGREGSCSDTFIITYPIINCNHGF
jgi:hypothetical protein